MRVKLVTTTKKTPNYLIYYLLIYGCWDFTAAGGLSPVAASRGYSVVAGREFLMAVASLVAEQGLQVHGLQELQHSGSGVVVHGLSCPKGCEIFLNQGLNPCPLH